MIFLALTSSFSIGNPDESFSCDDDCRHWKRVVISFPASLKDIDFHWLLLWCWSLFLIGDLVWPTDHKNLPEA
ncbi:hypothetical protein BgiMline_006091, partial [Biomphalaria glabrata]